MRMKTKAFWKFYAVVSLALIAASAVPIFNFARMLTSYYHLIWAEYNATAVIPFFAVSTALTFGFMLMPALRGMPGRSRLAAASAAAAGVFIGLELFAETAAARFDASIIVMTSRMMRSPEEIAELSSGMAIPWKIRAHYYVFSLILLVAIINFLYNLVNNLFGNGKPDIKTLVLQGAAALCYALAYIFVGVMRFNNLEDMQLTIWSVVNAAACFSLAAVAVGLYSASFVHFKGIIKFVPSFASAAAVLLLYGVEYIMLGGVLYAYHDYYVMTAVIRVLITVCPGIAVYFLLRRYDSMK